MNIIDPWIEVENFDGVKIMKNIERACRTCYRSEGLITEDDYENALIQLTKPKGDINEIY